MGGEGSGGGGVSGPPTTGGISPLLAEKIKFIIYFAVILVKIGFF